MKQFYEELPEYLTKNELQDFAFRLTQFIKKDFCEKYIEIMKIRSGDNSKDIALFCVAMLLKLLHPLIPFVTEKIWKLYNFKGELGTNAYIPDL
ncbi:MAG: class I tRNA ligase family protein [bacterium]